LGRHKAPPKNGRLIAEHLDEKKLEEITAPA
jgi:hypothetical protein